MQKTITLVELYRHSEVLRNVADLLLHNGKYRVQILTNTAVYEDCYTLHEHPKINWLIQQEADDLVFLRQQMSLIANSDLLLFITIAGHWEFFAQQQWPTKTLLLLHNGNSFLAAQKNLAKPRSVKDFIRLMRFYAFSEAKQREKVLVKMDALCFPSVEIHQHLLEGENDLSSKFRFTRPLPIAYYEGLQENNTAVLRIAIPGVVTEVGRDYQMVVEAFRQIVPEWKQQVELTLLGSAGSAYGQKIAGQLRALQTPNFSVQTFDEIIDQKTFDEKLRKTDLLILPLRKSYRRGIVREIYGYTNISGGINDMIRFGIPVLITPHYPLPSILEPISLRYDTAEKLGAFIREGAYRSLREKAPVQLEVYRKEKRAAQLLSTLMQALSL